MSPKLEYSFTRYLAAKKSVDDRALNRQVWESLAEAISLRGAEPLRVLEIGAGIGTMLERALERGLFARADYTAIDAQPENMRAARERLQDWSRRHGYRFEARGEHLALEREQRRVSVSLQAVDLFDFAAHPPQPGWNLVIAHAFLDLVDIPATLPKVFNLLEAPGLFYFTINFDGATLLEPAFDPPFDELLEQLYHRTMDERITAGAPSGDSRAGRHLFAHLVDAGAEILEAGPSDWVVFPRLGAYPGDEAYFLHFIIHTMHTALRGRPELDASLLEDWAARRHHQIELGELVYIAHQLDFAGRYPA